MQLKPPDVMVLCSEWPERALLRAQLVEDGHEVVAIETWPMPKLYRQSGMKPRVILIDLQGLADPRVTLDEVRLVHPPERTLVVTALGSVTADVIRALGFNVVERPVSIGQIAARIAILLADIPREEGRKGASCLMRPQVRRSHGRGSIHKDGSDGDSGVSGMALDKWVVFRGAS